nr:hypothetical protein [Tanacetum cinerariifolium]
NDIVIGLPKLKFIKDHLCSSCELGKAKQKSFQTKTTPSSKRRLQLLHMDLCGPMRVASINGKKYVLVIVDDYSRYTWTHFLRSKDETPTVLIDFLRLVQRGLHTQVRIVLTDKGTRNRTLVDAAQTMLSAAKVPLFFWAKANATTCYTQNHSLVIPIHEKTPYQIINDRKPSVNFFHIFGSLCYIVRDGENLKKMKEKGKPTIFSNSLERQDFSKSKSVTKNNVSNDFSKPVTAQILPPNMKSILKNTNVLAPGMYKLHTKPTQTRTLQLPHDSRKSNKRVSFSTGIIPTTSVSRPKLKSNLMEDRVLLNHSQGKKPEVEDHHRNVKFSKNKTSVTACNDNLNAKTSNVNFVCATCGKCVLNDKHDMCVLKSLDGVNSKTKMPIVVPPYDSDNRWTKDHSLEQVCRNPSKPVQTRQQLATDLEIYMFTLTRSTAEPKNIKEKMADSAWIEVMREELHQFDRLQV